MVLEECETSVELNNKRNIELELCINVTSNKKFYLWDVRCSITCNLFWFKIDKEQLVWIRLKSK